LVYLRPHTYLNISYHEHPTDTVAHIRNASPDR
jgi:hypothetical protein